MSQSASPRPENIRIVGYFVLIVGLGTTIGGSGNVEKKVSIVHERLRLCGEINK